MPRTPLTAVVKMIDDTAVLTALATLLEEGMPTPVCRGDFDLWCEGRIDPTSVLRALGAECFEVEGDMVIVSYGMKASLEVRAVALLFALGPMTMPELRKHYRSLYPKAPFSEASLRIALSLDNRIQETSGGRYFYKSGSIGQSLQVSAEDTEIAEESTLTGSEDAKDCGSGYVTLPLAALAIPARALRRFTLHGVLDLGSLLDRPDLMASLPPRDRLQVEDILGFVIRPQPQEVGGSGNLVRSLDTQITSPQFLRLDGIVDQATFLQALETIAEGGTIRLGSTRIELKEPCEIRKSLTLVGVGCDESVIVYVGTASGSAIELSGKGRRLLRKLSVLVEPPGSDLSEETWMNCLMICDGHTVIEECRFSGALSAAVEVGGDAWTTIFKCQSSGSHYGIFVADDAAVVVDSAEIHGNSDDGIYVRDQAFCLIRDSELWENEGCGIYVDSESFCIARENLCRNNAGSGILFRGRSIGAALANKSFENKTGIQALESTFLSLEKNECSRNNDGIIWNGSSCGRTLANVCSHNSSCGIYIGEDSAPLVKANVCTASGKANILPHKSSRAILVDNV